LPANSTRSPIAATISRYERGITASRRLGLRARAPKVAFNDRLAPAFGLARAIDFKDACLSALDASACPDR
jgi:hypothetical protein